MSISKTIKVIDPQLFSSSGNPVRDTLGFSINSMADGRISDYDFISLSSSFSGLKPVVTYAYRLIGRDTLFANDKQWLKYINGGQFSDIRYAGIISDATYADHHNVQTIPYSLMETKKNNSYSTLSPNYISVEPVLNKYYDNYDSYCNTLSSVTEIPNAYSLLTSLGDPDISEDGSGEDKIDTEKLYRFDIPTETFDLIQNPTLQKNILFAESASYAGVSERENFLFVVPHYNKISFDFEKTGDFVKQVEDNNFKHRFIKSLKDVFLGEDGSILPTEAPFTLESTILNESGENETTQVTTELKLVDAYGILEYSLIDYDTQESNFKYFLENSADAQVQYKTNSISRYNKTYPSINQIVSLRSIVSDKFNDFIFDPLEDYEKYNETVAYRIEKVGGSPSGDTFTQDTVQNFWLLNSDDVERFVYADSQVVYGQTYTYKIYKYILIIGTEYSYSDFRVSRKIANLTGGKHCLEIFDPSTGESAAPIYNSDFDDTDFIDNELGTGAQLNSSDRYICDFQLNVGVSAKIVEVPMLTKEVTILDVPPPAPMVIPFYFKNDSQRIGFNIKLDTTNEKTFPTTIGSAEAEYKNKFLVSNDLGENEEFFINQGSLPMSIEMLRIDTKPDSLTDFQVSTSKVQSLMIPNVYETYRDTVIYDKIETNKKYFYLFRVLNEVDSPAFSSPVIEVELVSDGGYKFAIFESYAEEELGNKKFSKSIDQFKKLISIVPNINNFIVDQSSVDFSQTAKEQKTNVKFGAPGQDLVWDKTFKLRLTSKKTGKKIDINLTYKQDG